MRAALTWAALALALGWPLWVAATSPLLAWREPVYIVAGLAGVAGMCLLLVQPLLIGRLLPVPPRRARVLHRAAGIGLVACVVLHVAGLWITSPPDMVDALTFTSPTLFTPFGVVAMWAVFSAAGVALMRSRVPRWRGLHLGLAVAVVGGTVVHALLIEGTMGTVSKAVLAVLVVGATGWVILRR